MRWCFVVEEEMVYGVTFWIVADLEQASGRQVLLNALKHMVSSFYILLLVKATLKTKLQRSEDILNVCVHRM